MHTSSEDMVKLSDFFGVEPKELCGFLGVEEIEKEGCLMSSSSISKSSSSSDMVKSAFDEVVGLLLSIENFGCVFGDKYFSALSSAELVGFFAAAEIGEGENEEGGVGVGDLIVLKSKTSFFATVTADVLFKKPNTPPVAGLGVAEDGLGGIGEGVSEIEKLFANLLRKRDEEGAGCAGCGSP